MPRKKDIYFAAETGLEFQAANEMHTEGRHGTHRWKGRRFDPHSLGEEPPPLEGCQVNRNHRMFGVSFGLVGHLNVMAGGHRVMAQQLLKSNRTTNAPHISRRQIEGDTSSQKTLMSTPVKFESMTKCFILLHDMSFQ